MARVFEDHPLLRAAIERGFRAVESDPQILLEAPGGPEGMTAEIIVARLFGHDEQLDHEMRLDRALPVVEVPVPTPLTRAVTEGGPVLPDMRVARYRLQSGYSVLGISAELLPPDIPLNTQTMQARLLCLRYKRDTSPRIGG